jgi:hypothetical protein
MKIFVFKGTFIFQRYLCKYMVLSFSRSRYIDLTVNLLDWVKLHQNWSSCVWSWMPTNLRWSHLFHRTPITERLNSILIWTDEKVWATIWSLCLTTLYIEGYWAASVVSPSQIFFQKWMMVPLAKTKDPLEKNSSLTFMRPFQKRCIAGFTSDLW